MRGVSKTAKAHSERAEKPQKYLLIFENLPFYFSMNILLWISGVLHKGEEEKMKSILIQWIISAASLLIVAHIIPGFQVESIGTALFAAIIIGLINATIGLFLKIITIPISILTFGIFLLVINGLMLMLASSLVSGFHVAGFWTAFFAALILAIVSTILRSLLGAK